MAIHPLLPSSYWRVILTAWQPRKESHPELFIPDNEQESSDSASLYAWQPSDDSPHSFAIPMQKSADKTQPTAESHPELFIPDNQP
jgi:hypothetical protein